MTLPSHRLLFVIVTCCDQYLVYTHKLIFVGLVRIVVVTG